MLTKFLGKALASMVLTKEAREVAGGLAKHAVRNATQKIGPGKLPDAALQAVGEAPAQGAAAAPAAIDRAELIRRAMEVRASKQSLLAELKPEERARLEATAMRAFLGESKSKE